jgi:predicted  nucleic acid-binding Zn-ribbon protein
MSDEIDGFKARQSVLEDELLEIMEALEPVDERLVTGGTTQNELEERLTVARASLGVAETTVDRELAEVTAARPAALAPIPKAWLDRYEKLRAHLGGVAVATLDGPRCTGCNLMLPTRELEHVRAAAPEVIIECEQCGRILVR